MIKNFLIVYNWRESRLDHWRDIDRELKSQGLGPDQARDLYREYELRFKQSDGYEVVLIGSDSIETIRETHAHYFGELTENPFAELLAVTDPPEVGEPERGLVVEAQRREVRLRIDASTAQAGLVRELARVIRAHPGNAPVYADLATSAGIKVYAFAAQVEPSPEFYAEVRRILGDAAIRPTR